MKLFCILIYPRHELVILVFATEVVFNDFKCFSVDLLIVMTLKKFNLVYTCKKIILSLKVIVTRFRVTLFADP